MATVTITGATVRDVTGTPDNRPWYLAAVTYQDGHDGGVITPKRSQALLPIAGMLSFDAEPGITVRVQNPDGDFWYVTIPEEDIDLWDLIAAAVAFPPGTSAQAVGTAVDSYLDANPVLPDRLRFEGDYSGSGDYMVNDVVRYTDPAPSPTMDLTGLYVCITDHTSGSPKVQPGRWELVSSNSPIPATTAALTGYDVILLAGQSNIVGGDNTVDGTLDAADSRIFEWPCSGANVGTIQPAIDPLHQAQGVATQVGPGVAFARWWAGQNPGRKVLLVPAGYGGTGFEASSGTTARWKVGYSGGTNLYDNAISKTNGALAAAGPGARLAAILWCQGEADSATSAATYKTDLLALIDGFRTNITGAAKVPFVILSMVPDNFAGNAGRAAIDAVHVDLPYVREFCGYTVGLSGHGVGDSGVHYDAVAQRWNGSVALPGAFRRARTNQIGTAPNPVTDVVVSRDPSVATTVNVTWTAAVGRVTDYTVQYRLADGSEWTTLTRDRSLACAASITSVGLGNVVEVRVLTVNEAGTSTASTSAKVALLPTPTVSVTQTASDTVTVTTTAVLGGSGAYRVDYKLSAGSTWTLGTVTTNLTTTISGLTTSAYDFRVCAFTAIGAAVVAATSYTLGLLGINPASISATIAQAYGLRKVLTTYSGYAIKVRRSSDNTEQDIGFSGADLDTAALLSFCGAGSGYISKWYDQSGSSKDLVQATTGSQPKIVNSGSLITNNGRPAVLFDGTDDYLERTTAELYSSGAATVCGVASGTSNANTQECIFGEGGTGSNNARYFINKCANAKFGHNVVDDTGSVVTQDISDTADAATFGSTCTQWTWLDSGTLVTRYRGGTGLLNNSLATTYSRSGKTLTLNRQTMGALHRLALTNYAAFQPSEFVIINAAANSTDRQFIEANQKAYFGTPTGL